MPHRNIFATVTTRWRRLCWRALAALPLAASPLAASKAATYTITPIKIPGAVQLGLGGMAPNGLYYGSFRSRTTTHLYLFTQSGPVRKRYDIGEDNFASFAANSAGNFAGSLGRSTSTYHFTLTNGRLKLAFRDNPDAILTYTDAGDILGRNIAPQSGLFFGRYTPAGQKPQILRVPGYANTVANAMNSSGTVIGDAYRSHIPGAVGFIYAQGNYSMVQGPNAVPAAPIGINDSGALVMVLADNSAYLYIAGAYTKIAVPGASGTYPRGVNNANAVYGTTSDASKVTRAFVYKAGAYTIIDPLPGASFSGGYLYGMDTAGNFIGVETRNGKAEPFYAACTGTGC